MLNVDERLDVALTMQEIKNGVCDLVDLANWLAKVLQDHCAPMRDNMVDRMQQEIKRGATENRPDVLVKGIQQLLNILEAMKLDVANHQIRHMRPLLVDDTVHFQRRYNAHRIGLNKIDVPKSRMWLEEEMEWLMTEDSVPNPLQALTSALLRGLLYNDIGSLYPHTFYLDAERLRALRMDLHSIVFRGVCRDVLVEMTRSPASKSELGKAADALCMSLAAIVGSSGKWEDPDRG